MMPIMVGMAVRMVVVMSSDLHERLRPSLYACTKVTVKLRFAWSIKNRKAVEVLTTTKNH
jgi:hypothetical protein